jgi:hypothetical protein
MLSRETVSPAREAPDRLWGRLPHDRMPLAPFHMAGLGIAAAVDFESRT